MRRCFEIDISFEISVALLITAHSANLSTEAVRGESETSIVYICFLLGGISLIMYLIGSVLLLFLYCTVHLK